MQIDQEKLREHYASLNDEELLGIKREDLTEIAQDIYDLEIVHRGLDEASAAKEKIETTEASFSAYYYENDDETADPDWHQNGVAVCSMTDQPGSDTANRISKAQTSLQAAGIPSHLSVTRSPEDHYDSMEILVPARYAMHAHGIMDRDVFNDEFETYWRDHLGLLSNEDLRTLDPEIFCVGLLDRIARMKRAYVEEMAKRNLKARGM
jgi:hypothetical protein